MNRLPALPARGGAAFEPAFARRMLRLRKTVELNATSCSNAPAGPNLPFPGLSAARQRPFRVGLDPGGGAAPHAPESSEDVNRLFPQACVNPGSFPRANRTHINPENTDKPNTHTSSKTNRRFTSSSSGWSCGQINQIKTGTRKPQGNLHWPHSVLPLESKFNMI